MSDDPFDHEWSDEKVLTEEEEAKRLRLRAAYKHTFRDSLEGRDVYQHLKHVLFGDFDCYQKGDPYGTAYATGMRRAFLLVKNMTYGDQDDERTDPHA